MTEGNGVVRRDVSHIRITVAKIEEHLKTLNGTVARHELEMRDIEKDLKKIDHDVIENKINLSKIVGIGSTAGGITGSALGAILYFTMRAMGV